jgi:hypothetical protein
VVEADEITTSSLVLWGYRINEKLGVGPLGTVYAADDLATGQRVAFRGFRMPRGSNPKRWRKAKEKFAAALAEHAVVDSHPAIQSIIRFGEDRGVFYVVTEYFVGKNLREKLDADGPLSLREAIRIMTPVAAALDYAATFGLAHTDITPHNIIVTDDAAGVRVINFGLAHARDKSDSPYAAPEQALGAPGDTRSDIFSAGSVIYELLSGNAPFSGANTEALKRTIARNKPMPLGDQPPYVRDVLRKMMATNPGDRYATAGDALSDLAGGRRPHAASAVDTPAVAHHNGPGCASEDLAAIVTGARHREPTLYDFHVAKQDVLELGVYAQAAGSMLGLNNSSSKRVLATVLSVALIGGLILHALRARIEYDWATVAAVTGNVRLVSGGAPAPLAVGQRISPRSIEVIQTGSGASVVLKMRGCRVKVMPDTKLAFERLAYSRGAVRQLQLLQGKIYETVDTLHRPTARFSVAAWEADIRSNGGAFSVEAGPHGRVTVNAFDGPLKVTASGATAVKVSAPHSLFIAASAHAPLVAPPISGASTDYAEQHDLLAPPTLVERIDTALALFEDRVILPLLDDVNLVRRSASTKALKDVQSVESAKAAMSGICILIQTTEQSRAPSRIDLETLAPLDEGFDSSTLLSKLDGHHLLGYRALDGVHYEFIARAANTQHTLLRARDGAIDVIPKDDEPGVLASFGLGR